MAADDDVKFNVEIRFTGICALVPDKAFDADPTKVCVVLPHAFFVDLNDPHDAADDTPLRRHRAMIQYHLRNVPGMDESTPDAIVVWYLDKQRVKFSAEGAEKLKIGDLSQVMDLSAVAPDFDQVDPANLGHNVTGDGVTQVMFDIGYLYQDSVSSVIWKFTPSVLSDDTVVTRLASEVVLTLSNVTSFTMSATPVSGGDPIKQTLTPKKEGDTIEVVIAHLCEDNPLRWETENFKFVDDRDTKWYFQLLSDDDRADLVDALDLNELPIPRPTDSNGQGADCSPAKAKPTDFVMD